MVRHSYAILAISEDEKMVERLVIPVFFSVDGNSGLQKTRYFGFTLTELASAFTNLRIYIYNDAINNAGDNAIDNAIVDVDDDTHLNKTSARIITSKKAFIAILKHHNVKKA